MKKNKKKSPIHTQVVAHPIAVQSTALAPSPSKEMGVITPGATAQRQLFNDSTCTIFAFSLSKLARNP